MDELSMSNLALFEESFTKKVLSGHTENHIAVEIEMFPFTCTNYQKIMPTPLLQQDELDKINTLQLLDNYLEKHYGSSLKKIVTDETKFHIKNIAEISFEPGGQIEVSSFVYESPCKLLDDMQRFIGGIESALLASNVLIAFCGCNPWHTVEEIGIQNKKQRYVKMQEYFNKLGPYGVKMMRQTASLQINVDIGYEEQFAYRWYAAHLLSPFMTAIFANSPIIDNSITEYVSYRSLIWQMVDKTRTGFPKCLYEDKVTIDPIKQYFNFAVNANIMFFNNGNSLELFGEEIKFIEWANHGYNHYFPDIKDWETHLSTLFPNIRLRNYLEIRYIDCPLRKWITVPIVILLALIYDDDALCWIVSYLNQYKTKLSKMQEIAANKGMHDLEIGLVANIIYRKALEALDRFPSGYFSENMLNVAKEFYDRYTSKYRCQADDLLEAKESNKLFELLFQDYVI